VADARPSTVDVGETVVFDGSGSSDDRQSPSELTYEWAFGDESDPAAGQSVTHAYEADGIYIATLTVTDADGLTDTDTIEITVGEGGSDADLRVTAIEAVENTGSGGQTGQPRAGDKVVIQATISNAGTGEAVSSSTSFELDGQPLAGSPGATSAIAGGA
jgi:serine protease